MYDIRILSVLSYVTQLIGRRVPLATADVPEAVLSSATSFNRFTFWEN